jgi:hypothetical protein
MLVEPVAGRVVVLGIVVGGIDEDVRVHQVHQR